MGRRAYRQNVMDYGIGTGRKKFRAVSYVRLSGVDKGDSIAHQKAIIREYVRAQEDIQIVLELEDCHRSGTHFHRAGFLDLMQAIEKREVDCVIVKDLSRFGRNLHEVSEYLELVFPRLGVRFISILDGYDSEKRGCFGEGLLLQVKCLLYERYAKDISRKIHTTVELIQKRGEIVGSVPYGYRKVEKNVITVTEAEQGVRLIFQLALSGMSNREIAAELDRLGYATPSEYRREGILRKKDGWNKDGWKERKKSQWQASSVGRILANA